MEKKNDDEILEGIIVDTIDVMDIRNNYNVEHELRCRLICCAFTIVLLITAFFIDNYVEEFI